MTAPTLERLLRDGQRRRVLRDASQGLGVGLAIAIVVTVVAQFRWTHSALPLGAASCIVGLLAGALRPRADLTLLLDRATPGARNLIVTAVEITRGGTSALVSPTVAEAVVNRADRLAGSVDLVGLLPVARRLVVVAGLATLWIVLLAMDRPSIIGRVAMVPSSPTAARIDRIEVVIASPQYVSRAPRELEDPARIEALAGSRVRIAVRADAESLSIETVAGSRTMPRDLDGRFVAELVADADGFLAIEPWSARGVAGPRRLMGFTVRPDAAPRVRLTTPGRDLLVPDAARRIDVVAEAEDDFGLRSLRVRYTKVSGSGEDFTFVDGEVAVAVEHLADGHWRARGVLRLDTLGLERGDMVVYRAIAADHRPGASPGESDSHIIEVTAPGAVAASGFALDDERDRYALSQQMVIQKTERLLARRSAMPADSFLVAARTIAAEQRSVRAEFVFMMGGELAHDVTDAAGFDDLGEHAEAEAEDDILAGRHVNRGRIDIVRAIRSMSRASALLDTAAVGAALAHERTALVFLEAAFARTQYILRALTERERLDPERRLTGMLADAAGSSRAADRGEATPHIRALRAALADLATVTGSGARPSDMARRLTDVAQSLLRLDPGAPALQAIADELASAAAAHGRGARDAAQRSADTAAARLAGLIRASQPMSSPRRTPLENAALDGALADALRTPRRGGPP